MQQRCMLLVQTNLVHILHMLQYYFQQEQTLVLSSSSSKLAANAFHLFQASLATLECCPIFLLSKYSSCVETDLLTARDSYPGPFLFLVFTCLTWTILCVVLIYYVLGTQIPCAFISSLIFHSFLIISDSLKSPHLYFLIQRLGSFCKCLVLVFCFEGEDQLEYALTLPP